MRGEHKRKKAKARPGDGTPQKKPVALVNPTQLGFAVVASGASLVRWAVVLTLRWPSFSGGSNMFHIFQAASLWSPVQLVGPRAPRNGGIHWVVSCPCRVGSQRQHYAGGAGPPYQHGWLPGGSTRLLFSGLGRRRMGSVGSWPLAKLLAQQREVTANDGTATFWSPGPASQSSPWGHPRSHPAA